MWPFKKSNKPDLKELVQSQVLTMKPNDTLVIKTDAHCTPDVTKQIRDGLQKTLGFGVNVLVVPGDTDVMVLRSGQPNDGKPPPTPMPSSGSTRP